MKKCAKPQNKCKMINERNEKNELKTEMWKCQEPDWSLTPMICRGKYNLHIGVGKLSDIINSNIYLFRYFQKQVLIFTDVKGFLYY